ncbi:hypothetical protein [Mechercharimyces sp. CAU 1602]|uniref:hypothetical protein n=1 Tax=Mechercharimyces sp. CAU 1602 TaxID=2973933 RepID=UPI0021629345|nr:hypothetical protein [Mechercharimyces sp. CAU 1602]MCS1349992.1 hypothetical protein [Mechercharimyces sp. CAU 1602]
MMKAKAIAGLALGVALFGSVSTVDAAATTKAPTKVESEAQQVIQTQDYVYYLYSKSEYETADAIPTKIDNRQPGEIGIPYVLHLVDVEDWGFVWVGKYMETF